MSILSNAAEVLRCFSAHRLELSLTEVTGLLGMPKSNASRLLRAMRDAGFLEQVPGTRRYRAGLLMFEMGHTYRRGSPLLSQAHAAVSRISRDCGHTGYVSIRDGCDVMGLTYHEGSQLLRVGTPIGERLSASATATGRALLARLGDDAVRALFPEPLQPPSPNSPRDMEELLGRLARIRERGFEIARHEANPGIDSLATAVGDPASGEEVSLCIVYPSAIVSEAERDDILAAMLREARAIAAMLGDPSASPCPTPPESDRKSVV